MSPASLWRGPHGDVLSLHARSQPGTEASNNHLKEPLWMWSFSLPVVSDSFQQYGLQHARLLCPSLPPGVCANSCPFGHGTSGNLQPMVAQPASQDSTAVWGGLLLGI